MTSPNALQELRRRLAEVVEGPRTDAPGLSTGIEALDAALPTRGFPLGRLTEVVGAPGSGKTSLMQRVVEHVVRAGWWVAYIDAERMLVPRDWAHIEQPQEAGDLWMVRPRDPARGAWCADVLLRSGAFRMVVLDGAPVLSREVAVRLTRLAKESDTALVALSAATRASDVAGAIRLRMSRKQRSTAGKRDAKVLVFGKRTGSGTPETRPIPQTVREPSTPTLESREPTGTPLLKITLEKGGDYQTMEAGALDRDDLVARRVRAHPEVPDRRGVARRSTEPGISVRINARSRRCAEPDIPDEPFLAIARE